MTHQEAIALIQGAKIERGTTWADFGSGDGTFTQALAELVGAEGTVYAVDQDVRTLGRLGERRNGSMAYIETRVGDFTRDLKLPMLDGVLMANALHYVQDQGSFLQELRSRVLPGGKLILVEYDTDQGNTWVPFPVSLKRFQRLAKEAGLGIPEKIGSRPSRYGYREIFAAVCRL